MKNKAFCIFIALILTLSAFAGCNSESESVESSLTDYSAIPETPVEDFEFSENESGGMSLTRYFGGEATVKIPAYADGKPVTEVCMYAFLNNQKLKTLIFPSTAKTVSGTRFDENCSSVEIIVLNDGLEEIDSAAFRNCTALKSINLPQSLKEFGSEVFSGCASLQEINLLSVCFNENADCAFGETGLESIEIPNGVTEIPRQMFIDSAIKSVKFPSTLKTIGAFAFSGCPIEALTLPEELTTIKQRAFYGTKLREVTLPESVTDFREDSFGGNTDMQKLIVLGSAPENFYQMGPVIDTPVKFFEIHYKESAIGFDFPRWNGFPTRIIGSDKQPLTEGDYEYAENQNGITITAYFGNDNEVKIPGQINGKPVTAIGGSAFRNKDLASVSMPDSITVIQSKAFDNCDNLAEIEWPLNLKTIGDEAFSSCDAITSITIPEGVEEIGSEAFLVCAELSEVSLPESIKFVGERAFSNTRKLKSAELRADVEYGEGVFSFSGLETVVIEEGVTAIPNGAFCECNIIELAIPSTVVTIGDSAFDSIRIKALTLPEGLESIGYAAFQSIYGLTELVIPASVAEMHDHAFNNCRNLASVTFLGDAPKIVFLEDEVFNDDANLYYTVFYREGASGFDGEYWQELDATVINNSVEE